MKTAFALILLLAGVNASWKTDFYAPRCEPNIGECRDLFKDIVPPDVTTVYSGTFNTHGCMDAVIILDCSKIMTAPKFNEAKNFIKKFIPKFNFGKGKARLTVISYCNKKALTHINFRQSVNRGQAWMLKQIDAIKFRQGKKSTLEGLKAMRKAFLSFPRKGGSRHNRFGMILTNGIEKEEVPPQEVDICFGLDYTGSMGSVLNNVKNQFIAMINKLKADYPKLKLRVALVAYNDYAIPGRPAKYVLQDFTTNFASFQATLATITAQGGGDFPENVWGCLVEAAKFKWNKNSIKLKYLATDAPGEGNIAKKGIHRDRITKALFELKCKIGLDRFHVLRTRPSWMTNAQYKQTKDYFQDMKLIGDGICGTTTLLPGNDFWMSHAKSAESDIINNIIKRIKSSVIYSAFRKIARQLCKLKVDLLGISGPQADVKKLNIILAESARKRVMESYPLIVVKKGESLMSKLDTLESKIKEGSNVCACKPCKKRAKCAATEDGKFTCTCNGKKCDSKPVGDCFKCRAEAIAARLKDPKCHIPDCRPDGSFDPEQYHEEKNESFCVNAKGDRVGKIFKGLKKLTCPPHTVIIKPAPGPCAIKKAKAKKGDFSPNCEENGSFADFQCYKNMCWCTQPNGGLVPSTFHPRGSLDSASYCRRHNDIRPNCRYANKFGFLRHPFDCTRYIRCAPGRVFTCSCPPNQYFDPIKCNCVFSSAVCYYRRPGQDLA